jgi:hypothetical protein
MTYGRSLDHYLKHFGQARADGSTPAFTEMAFLAKDRAGLRKLLTASAFASRTWCGIMVSPERRHAPVHDETRRLNILDALVASPTS